MTETADNLDLSSLADQLFLPLRAVWYSRSTTARVFKAWAAPDPRCRPALVGPQVTGGMGIEGRDEGIDLVIDRSGAASVASRLLQGSRGTRPQDRKVESTRMDGRLNRDAKVPLTNKGFLSGTVLPAAMLAMQLSASADPAPAVIVAPAPLVLTLEVVPAKPLPGQQLYWLARLRNSSDRPVYIPSVTLD